MSSSDASWSRATLSPCGLASAAGGTRTGFGRPLGRSSAGILYVFHGQPAAWPAAIELRDDLLPSPEEVRLTQVFGANGRLNSDQGDTLAYSAAPGDIDGDGVADLITNEMLGNGSTRLAEDVGNLIVLSLPEPRASNGLALAVSCLWLLAHSRRWRHAPRRLR